jgi:hypothetical protein
MVGRLGFAHLAVRQHFSPVKSRDFTAKVCNPVAVCKDCDTKAELNRRGEVCEASLTPGFRVA